MATSRSEAYQAVSELVAAAKRLEQAQMVYDEAQAKVYQLLHALFPLTKEVTSTGGVRWVGAPALSHPDA